MPVLVLVSVSPAEPVIGPLIVSTFGWPPVVPVTVTFVASTSVTGAEIALLLLEFTSEAGGAPLLSKYNAGGWAGFVPAAMLNELVPELLNVSEPTRCWPSRLTWIVEGLLAPLLKVTTSPGKPGIAGLELQLAAVPHDVGVVPPTKLAVPVTGMLVTSRSRNC